MQRQGLRIKASQEGGQMQRFNKVKKSQKGNINQIERQMLLGGRVIHNRVNKVKNRVNKFKNKNRVMNKNIKEIKKKHNKKHIKKNQGKKKQIKKKQGKKK